MNERQSTILRLIVEKVIEHAEPVSSGLLVQEYDLGISGATVRNDMAALEEAGYLRQPHTSAGRVPTEKGYRFYLEHFVEPEVRGQAMEKMRARVLRQTDHERTIKELAKLLVDLSGDAVIVGFGPRRSYYTGLAKLFAKPDFQDMEQVQALSQLVDRFDDILSGLFDELSGEPRVFLGERNPFGRGVSAVVVKVRCPDRAHVIGLVGPTRMDYARNLNLLLSAHHLMEEEHL